MKNLNYFIIACGLTGFLSCNSETTEETVAPNETAEANVTAGQSAVQDNESAKNIVQVASGSKDHTTLVAAVVAAELVDVLSNAGPFTVFAPTNDAFNKLPAGTVEGLLKPEKLEALQDILQYHVIVGVMNTDLMQDGQTIGMVNGGNVTISKKDGKVMVNGTATVVASIPTSNGVIHVVDAVLLPK
ncbi:MAG: fasciclin domain-containing protein [Bacteroidota bacterium]|nr:fasciclin domain-containing protein [Bacteroidota bacterium]